MANKIVSLHLGRPRTNVKRKNYSGSSSPLKKPQQYAFQTPQHASIRPARQYISGQGAAAGQTCMADAAWTVMPGKVSVPYGHALQASATKSPHAGEAEPDRATRQGPGAGKCLEFARKLCYNGALIWISLFLINFSQRLSPAHMIF